MRSGRLEAFSDAVIAILMTIMVLELHIPEGDMWRDVEPVLPVFGTYVLSFVYLGIYWNNHHHMLQVVDRVNGKILWANLHLLFWLSLVPFTTGWMGQNNASALPTAVYGVVLWFSAVAYTILQATIVMEHGRRSLLARAVGNDVKGKLSLLGYTAAVPLAFLEPWISIALYVLVALMWLVPDRRIESSVSVDLGPGGEG
jgi:uncharacterized membrane protein